MNKRLSKYSQQLNDMGRKALGFEDSLSFSHGYISALLKNGLISIREANSLKKVYYDCSGSCRYAIVKGELVDYYSEEEE